MNGTGDGDHAGEGVEEEECFHDSVERITSSCSSPATNVSDEESNSNSSSTNSTYDSAFPVPRFPSVGVLKYDVWSSRPCSIEERRIRLLREMGLSNDSSLSRAKLEPYFSFDFNRFAASSFSSSSYSSIHSSVSSIGVNEFSNKLKNIVVAESQTKGISASPVSNRELSVLPDITPAGEKLPVRVNARGGELDESSNCVQEVNDKVSEAAKFENKIREECGTSFGHSPIFEELLRRHNAKDSMSVKRNCGNGIGSKGKKTGSWFKSFKMMRNNMKVRRSSDERDASYENRRRRSSSATDDSQDVSFHGPNKVRVRQYGKSCKELTALYKSQEILAHNGSIWSIKFSNDGKYLASAGEDCVVHIWQVVESERRGDLLMDKSEDRRLGNLSMSPTVGISVEKKRRGRYSISRRSISLDQVVVPETVFGLSESPICSFRGHLDDVLDLSWSKSQHLLSSSMDKTVRLWHMSSNACLKIFSHGDYATCIQFNPVDERYFISGSLDAKVRIWSIPDYKVVDWHDLHEMVTAACYAPDGQAAVVGSYKGSCRIYNTTDNKLQHQSHINLQNKKKKSHHKKITGFQFNPGTSEVHVTSADSRIRVVDGLDLVHKFKGFCNTKSQISSSLTTNGKYLISASEDSNVYVWKYDRDCRPSPSRSIATTQAYEYFRCKDVSIAVPWPGSDKSLPNHPHASVVDSKRTKTYVGADFVDWETQKVAWGMVIVTAGLQGEIRIFQNFGLPVDI